MDPLWIILLGFLVYVEAKDETVKAGLGQDVTLNCSLEIFDFYWYMDIHSGFQSRIVRTNDEEVTDVQYLISAPPSKYKALKGNSLRISNITAGDFRNYYCAKKLKDEIIFEDTFHLIPVLPEPTATSAPPTDDHTPQPHTWSVSENEPVVYSSFILNVVLLVVTAVLTALLCMERKTCCKRVDDPSPLTSENPENVETVQYEEIQLSLPRLPPAALLYDGIYSKAQLPLSMQPPQGHLDTR